MTGRTGSGTKSQFKRWLSSPPRPHGEILADRAVSNLELFYDLVYVAVIAQAAQHLAHDVSVRATAEFAVIFAMVWIAWINGSLYVELHGRDDGRTRMLVFLQMALLALVAVFTADAAGVNGQGFALAYTAFLALMAWNWNSVRQLDRSVRPEFLPITGYYVVAMVASVVVLAGSAFLPAEMRLFVWLLYAALWTVGILFVDTRPQTGARAVTATDSLVERLDLFTIIVLGEVIVGVVAGLSSVERDVLTIATGSLGLVVGLGFWWLYFDLVGGRKPREQGRRLGTWLLSHLPITLSIAAAGAGMVGLIEHAHDAVTPASTAWLLAGAVALGLAALVVAGRSLVDAERLAIVYRPLRYALAAGALAALLAGWLAPAPWLLATVLVAILSAIWLFAVSQLIRAGAWGDTSPERAVAGERGHARTEDRP